MKNKNLKAMRAAFYLLCLFCFGGGMLGCLDNKSVRVAGGDDIPNGVEPLGKKSARTRDDSTDWNGFKSTPRTSPGMYDTAHVPDTIPDTSGSGHAAPKRSAEPVGLGDLPPLDSLVPVDTVVSHIKDTLKGTVETVHTVVKDSVRTVDSTVFQPIDPAHPTAPRGLLQVTGKVTHADTGIWDAFRYSDADGDGFLAPRAGSANLVDVDLSSKLAGGVVEHRTERMASGPDLDFNARGDNLILASAFIRTLGADTLDVYRLLDADGDSVVLDLSKDTNVVDLVQEHRSAQGSVNVTVSSRARIVVFSRDSTRNYAVRYRERRVLKDGGSIDILATGQAPDSAFRPGQVAAWIETHAYPAGDSLETRMRTFGIKLSAAPGAFQGDKLLSFQAVEKYPSTTAASPYTRFDFAFTCDSAVSDGHWLHTGAVQSSLALRAGGTLGFAGQAVAGGLDGKVTAADGQILPLFFDRAGNAAKRP